MKENTEPTCKKKKSAGPAGKVIGLRCEHERTITVCPPLDEDKLLNLFRSALRFAMLGGLSISDVDRAYAEAKRMG